MRPITTNKTNQKMPHKHTLLFFGMLIPSPQKKKFQEDHSILTNLTVIGRISYSLLYHTGRCSKLSEGTTVVMDFKDFSGLCEDSALPWKPEWKQCFFFRKASQVSCDSAEGEHYKLPDTLIPLRYLQGKISHWAVNVWEFPQLLLFENFPQPGQTVYSAFSAVQVNLSYLIGSLSLVIQKQKLIKHHFYSCSQKMLLHYRSQSQQPKRTNISGEE